MMEDGPLSNVLMVNMVVISTRWLYGGGGNTCEPVRGACDLYLHNIFFRYFFKVNYTINGLYERDDIRSLQGAACPHCETADW